MADLSAREPHIFEAMEACRPGHDDLESPEMSQLAAEMVVRAGLEERFARLQQLDDTLAHAIQDVPVPEGLAERLSAVLAAARPVAAAVADTATAELGAASAQPAAVATGQTASAVHRVRRRLGWFAAVGAVAAMALAAFWLWQNARNGQLTAPIVLDEAITLFQTEQPIGGRLLSEASLPWGVRFSSAVRQWSGTRWRPISGFLDHDGVAFDLTSSRGTRATLYAVARSVPGLPDEPPANPSPGTGNCTAAVWQQGGLLYVLVVQGDAAAYTEFLDLPRGPVA